MVRRVVVHAVLAVMFGALCVLIGPSSAVVAAPVCLGTQPSGAAAAAMALACGRSVEDLSVRTESSATVRNPDGTQRWTQYAQPRWARNPDGSWGDVDTTLRVVDGVVAPARTVLPVSFSAGGVAPLARLSHGRGRYEMSLSWPGRLPVPTLAGDTATYAEVLPGVDLRMTAMATGFAEVLVVKTRAAAANPALARVAFGLSGKGVDLRALADGGGEARNDTGELIFSAPTPLMWDSSALVTSGPGATGRPMPRTARMAAAIAGGQLSVRPDAAMLTSPDVTYPLFIDPSWTGYISDGMWKNVASRSDVVNSTSFTLTGTNGDAGSGLVCDYYSGGSCQSTPYIVRSMFRMQTYGVAGKHVLSATFNITQKWSWTCNPASNAKLWITPGISAATTWNNQGGWDGGHTATALGNHRSDGAAGCAGTGNVAFDTTGMVQYAQSQGWGDLTLGLAAECECTVNQWKKFDAGTASLSILFNSYPNVPDTLSTAGQAGCVTGASRPVVAVTNPVLSARVTDPDGAGEGDIGGVLTGEFTAERWNPSTGTWVAVGTATGTPQANGTTSPSPAPTFTTGSVYHWRARALDSWSVWWLGSGTDASGYTAWCEFDVDAVAPNPPAIQSDPKNSPFVAGKTVRLTFRPGGSTPDTDVTGYSWWVVDGAGTHATTFTAGSQATVDWTPIAGQATIHVKAKDRIQLSPTDTTYTFTAAQASTEVARWPLSEPAGSTVVSDITGHGFDAAVALTSPATLGAPGRIVNGATVVSFNGVSGNTITTAAPVLDLSRSFTVSAWVRLGDKSATHVLASQFGTDNSGFTLEYTAGTGEDRWEMLTFGANAVGTGRIRSTVVPMVGVWTLVTGVYDSAARTIRLYVNGVSQATQTLVAGVDAGGTMRIGRALGQPFSGSVSDVRVWDRVLSGAEVFNLSDPTSPDNVATDNVGQWLVEPESCFGDPTTCQDSSSYAHDVNLSGGVTTTTAGQVGSGLAYAGTDGVASTIDPNTGMDGPVLRTDQSFTVSAWVSLDALPTGAVTAVAQSATQLSGFYLGARVIGSPSAPRWTFAMHNADSTATGTGWAVAISPTALTAADIGGWTHLVGVYDAVNQTITLYVNGAQAATVSRTATPWNAGGALTIGAALWTWDGGTRLTDWWNGRVDTVYAYAGAVPASSISRIP